MYTLSTELKVYLYIQAKKKHFPLKNVVLFLRTFLTQMRTSKFSLCLSGDYIKMDPAMLLLLCLQNIF